MNERQKLKLIKKENGYKISSYVKSNKLVEIVEPKLSLWQRFKKRFHYNVYDTLTIRQKRVLHTIAPLWGNILEYNLEGDMVVTDDAGRRYNLDSMNYRHCLVGEVNGFGDTTCVKCGVMNIGFASLNRTEMRNSIFLNYSGKLQRFLDHYYENHMQSYYKK